MENLFNAFKVTTPNYDAQYGDLFESLTRKGGGTEEGKLNLGKHFSNNYELYMYSYFLGLYKDLRLPLEEITEKKNFSHAIQYWGSTKGFLRKDFTELQQYIFMSAVAKTDFDVVELDKGKVSRASVVKKLRETIEAYTNGGLNYLSEKIENNPNAFLDGSSFLTELVNSKPK